jgi:hypothetical protein
MCLARASERVNDLSHSMRTGARSAQVNGINGGGGREMHTGELASEGFLTRVGSDVRHKCEARGLREATRGPFTGVVGSERASRRTSWSIGSVGWV